ncbi:MAG: hypothetical protein R2759_10805 [Bacteroidales bacterium]
MDSIITKNIRNQKEMPKKKKRKAIFPLYLIAPKATLKRKGQDTHSGLGEYAK